MKPRYGLGSSKTSAFPFEQFPSLKKVVPATAAAAPNAAVEDATDDQHRRSEVGRDNDGDADGVGPVPGSASGYSTSRDCTDANVQDTTKAGVMQAINHSKKASLFPSTLIETVPVEHADFANENKNSQQSFDRKRKNGNKIAAGLHVQRIHERRYWVPGSAASIIDGQKRKYNAYD